MLTIFFYSAPAYVPVVSFVAPTVAATTTATTFTGSGKDMHVTTSKENKTSPTVVVVKIGDDRIIVGVVVVSAVVGLALLLVVICVVSIVLKKRRRRPRMSGNATPLLNGGSCTQDSADEADADDLNEHEYAIPTIVYTNQQRHLEVHHNAAYGATSDQIAISPNLAYVEPNNTDVGVVLSTNPAYGASSNAQCPTRQLPSPLLI